MDLFFSANLIIAFGGIVALLTWRRFTLMKSISVAGLASGCIIGLVDAVARLTSQGSASATIAFLPHAPLAFRIDPLSAFFLMAIYAICTLAAIYSYSYQDEAEKGLRTATGTLFFALLIVSMALVVTADNMLTFMLAWEGMSLSSFFLVMYDYQSEENRRAGYLYFVFSHVGAMFILAGFGLIYSQTGSIELLAAPLSGGMKIAVFVLCFIGFGSKAGIFPFHVWLPHAHPAAPSHISAVMSGVMIKTGIYGIIRIYDLLDLQTALPGEIVAVTGMVTGVLGVVYALGQHDLKRLLAYSSVENIGIILIGLGIGMIGVAIGQPVMAVLGFTGGMLHILNHALFKSLLFMGAGMVIHHTGTRSINALGGLIKHLRITGVTFLIGSLAIAGLPPFNGFVSEFFVYLGSFRGIALNQGAFVMSVLAIISLAMIGGLALALFAKVMGVAFQGEPRTAAAAAGPEHGGTMLPPLVILATACVFIGVFPRLAVFMSLKAVGALGLGYGRVAVEPFLQITTNISLAAAHFLVIAAVIMAVRTLAYKGKTVTRAGTWGCGFTRPTVKMQYTGSSFAGSILDFFNPLAPRAVDHPAIEGRFPGQTHYRSRIGDIAEMNMGRLVVRPILWLFDSLRWIQHGDIHLYIGYILAAIVALLFFM